MLFEKFQLIDFPFEPYVAGGILRQLMQQVGPWNSKLSFPNKPVKDEVLERAMLMGVEEGLSAFTKQLQSEAALASKLVENRFQLREGLDETDRLVGAAQGNGRNGE